MGAVMLGGVALEKPLAELKIRRIKKKRERRKKKHLFPSKCLHDLGCCYLGTGCRQQRGQREEAALSGCRC